MEQRQAAEVIVAVKASADEGMVTCPRTKPMTSAEDEAEAKDRTLSKRWRAE
jgi:hypothetical protein